jgi:hypothetical protein
VRRLLLTALLALAAALGLPAAAPAAAPPAIGIGEQNAELFASPHWARLGLRDARYIAAWDALRHPWQRQEIDAWMAAAQASGTRVLLGFGHSRAQGRERVLPSRRAFQREFRRFRERYPLVTDFLAWNEANHSSQPTWRRPDRAADYFDVIAADCRGCRIVAADVLDWPNMRSWLRAFRRHAEHRPRIWGLHNYIDANRFLTKGTRELLRAVRGEVWFTETGGLIERRQVTDGATKVWRHSPQRAARAMSWVIRLAGLSSRVRRVYVYHWQPGSLTNRWDSALLDRRGRPRPSYHVVRRWAERTAAARRR